MQPATSSNFRSGRALWFSWTLVNIVAWFFSLILLAVGALSGMSGPTERQPLLLTVLAFFLLLTYMVGHAQFSILRRRIQVSWWWIVFTMLGYVSAMFLLFFLVFLGNFSVGDVALGGAAVGLAQCRFLVRQVGLRALWWVPANAVAWLAGAAGAVGAWFPCTLPLVCFPDSPWMLIVTEVAAATITGGVLTWLLKDGLREA